jgi:hypothetical protein
VRAWKKEIDEWALTEARGSGGIGSDGGDSGAAVGPLPVVLIANKVRCGLLG